MSAEPQSNAVDINKIMETIAEEVQKKRSAGFYNDEDIVKAFVPKPSQTQKNDQPDNIAQRSLVYLNQNWDPKVPEQIVSHRRFLGPLIVFLKKALRKIMKPYTNMILHQQAEFNAQLIPFLNSMNSVYPKIHGMFAKTHEAMEKQYLELVNSSHKLANNFNELARSSNKKIGELEKKYDKFAFDLNAVKEVLSDLSNLKANREQLDQQYQKFSQMTQTLERENILQKHRLERMLNKMEAKYEIPEGDIASLVKEKEHFMDHSYFAFESRFRGSEEEIKKRQEVYVELFKDAKNVLDIGCGRGELLELFRNNSVKATGIDLNEEMILLCQEKKLDVKQIDAINHLNNTQDNSLGGIIASHLIEHLRPDLLIELIKLCWAKLEIGACLVFETPNPESVVVSATSFHLDISHIKPIHPEAIKFTLESLGFMDLQIKYLSPFPEGMKLQLIDDLGRTVYAPGNEMAQVINTNTERLNNLLFGYQDYFVMGKKGS